MYLGMRGYMLWNGLDGVRGGTREWRGTLIGNTASARWRRVDAGPVTPSHMMGRRNLISHPPPLITRPSSVTPLQETRLFSLELQGSSLRRPGPQIRVMMNRRSERTPLLQTVRVGPPRRRYPHSTFRRFCTIACVSLLICGLFSFLTHVFFVWPHHHPHSPHSRYSLSGRGGNQVSHDRLRSILLDTPSAEKAREWSRYYTSGPHLAGRNYSQAEWTMHKWQGWGVQSSIVPYDVYINYPVDHSLSLLRQSDKAGSWDTAFEASLVEDVLDEDPTTALDTRIPTFHGYSASGNATAPFVYVNYGTYDDFEDLISAGVDLKGKIAVARYGLVFRGLKVKRAHEMGMVAVLIYSDPGDDGNVTEANGYDYYPKGPARNPSSVQRGSVQYLSVRPGDP